MKKNFVLIFISTLFLSMGMTSKDRKLYQVISSHPHDIEELDGHIDTVYQEGRLWIVDLKDTAPADALTHLKEISGREKSYLYVSKKKSQKSLSLQYFDIKRTLKEVSAELIKKDVEDLAHYKTRAADTDENREVVKALQSRFELMGFSVAEFCYREGVCSIVAEKKGSVRPDEILLVEAHVDSVGKMFAGADDNASGTAVLMEMARVLKDVDNHKTLRFFVTNGEELGLLGAEHYVKRLKKSGEIKRVKFVINMDMVGYNSNGVVELETEPAFESMARWFADLAAQYTTLKTKITLGAWGSDHVPFLDAGVPALLTIEDWSTKTPCYHTACDVPSGLNYQYAAEIGKLNVAAIMTRDRVNAVLE